MKELKETTKESIKDRFKDYNEKYIPKEIDWGKPIGKEKI